MEITLNNMSPDSLQSKSKKKRKDRGLSEYGSRLSTYPTKGNAHDNHPQTSPQDIIQKQPIN